MNTATTTGNHNIVIQDVSDANITINVNGVNKTIDKKLDALLALFSSYALPSVQVADRTYSLGSLNPANFEFLLGQVKFDKQLPNDLKGDLLTDKTKWAVSLSQDLLAYGVSVSNKALDIFKHYGWLVEAFLQKMQTSTGRESTLRRLSFMTEAYQSSLRYLCYIQVAQLVTNATPAQQHVTLREFFSLPPSTAVVYDYLNLLVVSTDLLRQHLKPDDLFVPTLQDFVTELTTTSSDLYRTALFLDTHRRHLLRNEVAENDSLPDLLDEYLTALAFWLRQTAFVAQYRLVSVKDINLNFRVGMDKSFMHLYGELHGVYNEAEVAEEGDFLLAQLKSYTYNQSVLLVKNDDQKLDFNSYLSLSPLVIDQSVFTEKPTQTPEIYYFVGYDAAQRSYHFVKYNNELAWQQEKIDSNKELVVKAQNNKQPKLNELFKHLEHLFKSFRA